MKIVLWLEFLAEYVGAAIEPLMLKSWLTQPWSVDRWGRLLAGGSVLCFMCLGLLWNSMWFFGSILIAANLFVSALLNRCMLRNLLIRLGAREREDLYLPGG